ncbi:unnamed protein product [Echinostoma caproni]|uniref:LAM_G_DOMAIN domain-containing protein n=1 Tax=Echinostoma caproni TaxID=27848 RepID=A0A183A7E6_9TREM|nr:unnamed protein product [Echinostoma caproni]
MLLPVAWAIMGSPPQNLPTCLHGGTPTAQLERYRCKCIDPRMDRQCKLTLVSIETAPVEMKYGPISVQINTTSTFHVSLAFITNDGIGDGSILTVYDSSNVVQLKLFLKSGRPGMDITLGGSSKSLQFSQNPVMNDNVWHYLDVFVEAESLGTVTVYLMTDWCRSSSFSDCVQKQSLSVSSAPFTFGGKVQLGSDTAANTALFNGCIDKVNINGVAPHSEEPNPLVSWQKFIESYESTNISDYD